MSQRIWLSSSRSPSRLARISSTASGSERWGSAIPQVSLPQVTVAQVPAPEILTPEILGPG